MPLRPQAQVLHQECQQKYVLKVPGTEESQKHAEHSGEWVTWGHTQVEAGQISGEGRGDLEPRKAPAWDVFEACVLYLMLCLRALNGLWG